jgi:hypothetical protein
MPDARHWPSAVPKPPHPTPVAPSDSTTRKYDFTVPQPARTKLYHPGTKFAVQIAERYAVRTRNAPTMTPGDEDSLCATRAHTRRHPATWRHASSSQRAGTYSLPRGEMHCEEIYERRKPDIIIQDATQCTNQITRAGNGRAGLRSGVRYAQPELAALL